MKRARPITIIKMKTKKMKEDESIERETIYTIAGCGYEHDGVRRAVLEISMKYNMPVYLDTNSAWTYTPINRRKVHLVEWIKNVQNYDAKKQFYTIFKLCDQEGDKVSMLQWRLGKGNDCYTARKYVNHFESKTRKSWLMVAVDKGNINIANTLIQAYGADVIKQMKSGLHHCILLHIMAIVILCSCC